MKQRDRQIAAYRRAGNTADRKYAAHHVCWLSKLLLSTSVTSLKDPTRAKTAPTNLKQPLVSLPMTLPLLITARIIRDHGYCACT